MPAIHNFNTKHSAPYKAELTVLTMIRAIRGRRIRIMQISTASVFVRAGSVAIDTGCIFTPGSLAGAAPGKVITGSCCRVGVNFL
ncbi:MAG: hypothetical protein CL798_03930 [Chromatiales bacterium]|nr:hypothetical protein [Chromatiales bacterium]